MNGRRKETEERERGVERRRDFLKWQQARACRPSASARTRPFWRTDADGRRQRHELREHTAANRQFDPACLNIWARNDKKSEDSESEGGLVAFVSFSRSESQVIYRAAPAIPIPVVHGRAGDGRLDE